MAKQKVIDKKKQKEQNAVIKNAVDDFDKFEDFVSGNLKNIIVSFAVIAVLLFIGAIVYMQITKENIRIAGELSAADTAEELKAKIQKYGDSKSVFPARLRLGTIYFNDGKFKEAKEVYASLSVEAPAGEVRSRAKLNEAYSMEAMEMSLEAADKFAAIGQELTRFPEYIRNEANFSAARIYYAEKEPEKAKSCLKTIDYKKPGFWAAQGEKLLQRIN